MRKEKNFQFIQRNGKYAFIENKNKTTKKIKIKL